MTQETQFACSSGRAVIDDPLRNKGTAFSEQERSALGLRGLLPPHIETLEEQVHRAYAALHEAHGPMGKHIYLRALQDSNERLFYRLVVDHLQEVMPLIYTPTVGEACQRFSEIYRRPRGLFVSYSCRDELDAVLAGIAREDIEVIVVTDGERILGLGDQGVGGMGIPIGKLSLYVACGGVHPARTLPVVLDVGTNNKDKRTAPGYIGWRHERITGDDYLRFVDEFVDAVKRRWPKALLQFEDFAIDHATPLLERYRDQLCMFNDDVQGTAAVALGTLYAGAGASGVPIAEQRVVIVGAGSAGSGIATQIMAAMVEDGRSPEQARASIYLVDRPGLLHDEMDDLRPFQRPIVQRAGDLRDWDRSGKAGEITLHDVVRQARPHAMIGVSGQPGLFTEDVVREMAEHVEKPILFPLSNPNTRMEADPGDLLRWTDGRALVATGSPVDPVHFGGREYEFAQCNNTYVFPAIGLGVHAVGAGRVTDEMLRAAARALGKLSPAASSDGAPLLPPIQSIREVSIELAQAVAEKAIEQRVAVPVDDLRSRILGRYWEPSYV